MKASVLMPVYNGEIFLREAIESILNQTYSDFEFIIVDDGSTDGSLEIIQEYAETDSRIKILRNEHNSGICVSLNNGLRECQGEYIIRMDCDDISLPQRIETQIKFMDANPEIGVAGSHIEIFNEKTVSSTIYKFDTDPYICKSNLIFSPCIAHPTAIIRNSIIKQHDLSYEDYFRGMEDHYLWWEISQYCKITNVDKILLKYRTHSTQVSQSKRTPDFVRRLREFIRLRANECNASLSDEEFAAFCLYHEDSTLFNFRNIESFIRACSKINNGIKSKDKKLYKSYKDVTGKAISYIIDQNIKNRHNKIVLEFKAFLNNSLPTLWFLKRLYYHSLHPKKTYKCEFENKISFKDNRPRIAISMYRMNCGGVENALINLLKKIDPDKYNIDLWLLERSGTFLDRIPPYVNTRLLDTNKIERNLINTLQIRKSFYFGLKSGELLRTFDILLKYIFYRSKNHPFPAYKSALKRIEKSFPNYDIVLDFHGYISMTTYLSAHVLRSTKKFTWIHSENLKLKEYKFLYNNFDSIFAVSETCAKKAKAALPDRNIQVFHNFIDYDDILKKSLIGNKLPNGEELKLLSIGRLSEQKGFDIAIECASILKSHNLNFRWYICGDGELFNELNNLAKLKNVTDKITFLGYHNNPYGYLKDCDIYIQPSKWEGYAVTLMEAIILKKPIISTRVSGSEEAVSNNFNGFIVDKKPEDLAEKILLIYNDPITFAKFKENALNFSINDDDNVKILETIL